jgi:hypothetical protein
MALNSVMSSESTEGDNMRLKASIIFLVILSGTVLHFIITTAVSSHIAMQVGSFAGQVVAKGLIESGEKPSSSEKDGSQIYQNMIAKSNDEYSKWKVPMLLISLPIKSILNPLGKKIRIVWIDEPVRLQKISLDQVKERGRIIDNISNGVNSLSFGILVYLVYRFIMKVRSSRQT